VPICLVDHLHRSAHDPRQIEELYSPSDRPRRERVATVVDTPVFDACGAERGCPFPVAELLAIDVAAAGCRKQDRCIESGRLRLQCGDDALAERYAAPLPRRFRQSFKTPWL